MGSHLARALAARGERVRVLDNFSTGKPENLAGLDGRVEVLQGDLRDAACVAEAVRGADLIFHQAAFVSVPASMQAPLECFEVNVQGTLNLLEAVRRQGPRPVVLASSAAVYGDSQELPLREGASPKCLSPYAISKQVNEACASFYARACSLPVISLRYFNVYGPRQSPDSDYAAVIPAFIRRLLAGQAPTVYGDGLQSRDFVFASDVARANLLAAEHPQAFGACFNVCSGRETSLLDLLEALAEIFGGAARPNYAPPRPGDIRRSLGDPARAEQVLGFRARVGLVEGLAETVAWMRTGEAGRSETPEFSGQAPRRAGRRSAETAKG